MSDSEEREEAAGPSETLRPESEDMDDPGSPTQSDGGPPIHRPPSPTPSSVSIKSDGSMHDPPALDNGPAAQPTPESQINRPPSPTPSCVSMKSDGSMHDPPALDSGPAAQPDGLMADHLRDGVQEEVLDGYNNNSGNDVLRRVIENHKASLKKMFENISEGIIKPGAEILLNKIYTEVYITEGESEGVNKEHEVWQVESASRSQATEDTAINCNDLFKPLPGHEKHIRTVMTKGVAGIGKTVLVQKFILDWTDGIANQDVDFMFPLPFRELNLVKSETYSLHKLLLDFHPELKELKDGEEYKDCRVVFILDGLDESRLPLNFQQTMMSDLKEASSVDVLMTSLIQGTLFPSAVIWITSRPAAANQIPLQYINQVTEAQGFTDPQKEEYFRKRISEESQANRIISHIKTSRCLHIMCHIPVFCWIAATVLQQMLELDNTQEIPKTLTEMFIHFLLVKGKMKDQKYQGDYGTDKKKRLLKSQKESILKLAELAYKDLENGNLLFYEEDLIKCGIDISEASECSVMCAEILKEEPVLYQKTYCFVHLSIQEFLAALYVFHSYVTNNLEALNSLLSEEHGDYPCPLKSSCLTLQSVLGLQSPTHLDWLLKSALDRALKSRNGHLDLFIRFLMGISLESNQRLLNSLLNHTNGISETCDYIKKLNRKYLSPEQCINLFHCLFEMKDHSTHKEIQEYLSSSKKIKQKLSPAHCSTLSQMLLMSEEVLSEFDPKKYNTSDEGRKRLLPALKRFRNGRLAGCKVTVKSCEIIASVLRTPNSLIELDLKNNALGDSGVRLLATGLFSSHCKLQLLRLAGCKLTNKSCELVASVLQSSKSLMELDMSTNNLGDSGVQLLFKESHCKLQTLRLAECNLTETSCEIVASVLQLQNSLIDLGLSHNDLRDSGVQLLSKGLSSPHCKLQTLRLSDCLISMGGCGFLASALTSNSSHLKELDLSYNHPGESGLKLLSVRLEDPHCKLETLKIDHCAEIRLRGVQRYVSELTLDPNTAHRDLALSLGNRKVTWVLKKQPYSDHPERFDFWPQVFCREDLSGRCYWEAEWNGPEVTDISVAYKSIERKGVNADIILGRNANSWSLCCSPDRYSAWHNNNETPIPVPSSGSRRVGVYLDWPAGTLSFYSVSSDTLTHLHTFHSTFTEPLCPGFRVYYSSVSLCQIR
ncbi:NACHT, LRR and PYD domains-containing protein 12-like [Sardina pilchardus]|uniref:NACHT, LRR and PYD domains-containing protein 12-like n=1 Tax=Sardina pilchardus TaxID=27697 RepID=UPI002E0FCAB8